MNIAVYMGSLDGASQKNRDLASQLGAWIAESGNTLVYGGSNSGLMKAVADGALGAGGRVIGVIPDIPKISAHRHPGLSEYHYADTMNQRKQVMIELADAFIALPGGVGTLDEVTDVLALYRAEAIDKPCVLYSIDGFYEPFRQMLDRMLAAGYMEPRDMECLLFSEDLDEIGAFIGRWRG